MTLETFFISLNENAVPISLLILAAPWVVWVVCYAIPGRAEEPWVLSLNLLAAVTSIVLWSGYLAYTINTSGMELVVKQANIFLLVMPPYYVIASIWVSRQLMPLSDIPAFRSLQGVAMLAGVYVALAWFASRIRIYIVSFIPFWVFLWILAGLLLVGYVGYRRLMGPPGQRDPEMP